MTHPLLFRVSISVEKAKACDIAKRGGGERPLSRGDGKSGEKGEVTEGARRDRVTQNKKPKSPSILPLWTCEM